MTVSQGRRGEEGGERREEAASIHSDGHIQQFGIGGVKGGRTAKASGGSVFWEGC